VAKFNQKMKKTATLIALAGLSMAANPEHLHGSFRNRKFGDKPFVAQKPTKQSETLNADDELLLIYKPQYDIDPGMVIRPPRGYDIDPKMIIRPPYGDIDQGIFVKPRPTPKVMWADDDELIAYVPKEKDVGPIRQHRDDELFSKGVDAGMIIKPKRGDIDPKMIIKPKRGDIDPKIILNPKKDVIYADDELLVRPNWAGLDVKYQSHPVILADDELFANDDELIAYVPKEKDVGPIRQHRDDELFSKGVDAGMVIKPKRGDIDPKMIIKPKRGDIDPKIILNPKKDVIYADDELLVRPNWAGLDVKYQSHPVILADDELNLISTLHRPIIKQALVNDDELFANDDELIAYVPKEKDVGPIRQHRDDELFSKGVDAGMVIKPKRGDIDPKMIIKPKRGDFDPKIILNPKKDVIYADDELVFAQPMRAVDDELVALGDLLNDN